jgi:NADPH:quinone reductase
MRAIRIHEYGGPEVLRVEDVPEPEPGPGEVVIACDAIGVIYAETQVRAGEMARFGLAHPQFPYTFGRDVAGTVAAIGEDVDPQLLGRRFAASTKGGVGGYAERAIVSASSTPSATGAVWSCLLPIPDALSYEAAAALMGQGRTALAVARTAGIRAGDSVLVTAAGGAVGSLLLQLARAEGATTVIAAARGEAKLAAARDVGADVAIDYGEPGWEERVREATEGRGVNVVLDAVGGDVARAAYATAASGVGTILVYGLSSGALAELPMSDVLRRGLTLIGFSGARYSHLPQWVLELQSEIFELAAAGTVRPLIGRTFPLEDAAAAHAALEAREIVGKTLLIP